jgi:hypothetical protein
MKTQKKNNQGLHLQVRNNRWKWMAGATAATAAGVTSSQAITINLVGNYISGLSGQNNLNADLTGDGQPDVALTGAHFYYRPSGSTRTSYGYHYHFKKWSQAVHINGIYAKGYDDGDFPVRYEILGSQFTGVTGPYTLPPLTGKIPISFTDPDINGGRLTAGFLGVTVTVDRVQLDSVTYNTPDRGSSLALLAMGAGGVLALRRWRAARGRS